MRTHPWNTSASRSPLAAHSLEPAAARSPTPLTARTRRSRASTIELLPAPRCGIAVPPPPHAVPPPPEWPTRPRLGRPRPRPGARAGGTHASPPAVGRGADQAARRAARASARGHVRGSGELRHTSTNKVASCAQSACTSSNEDARPRAFASQSLTKPRASLPAKEKRRSRAKLSDHTSHTLSVNATRAAASVLKSYFVVPHVDSGSGESFTSSAAAG